MTKTFFVFLFAALLFSGISTPADISYANHLDDEEEEEDDAQGDPIFIPILFGVRVSDLTRNFGDPRDGGTRTHEGLDILAPKGTPIVSPTRAKVTSTGTGDSSGKYVRTSNPDGETFVYMHLNEIAVRRGNDLSVGDVIGYVGNTGNAKGGPAHLHFEIRRNRRATDPYPRLTKVFSLEDKIEFLEDILRDVDDEDEFAEFLVSHYAQEFISAKADDIDLPEEIEDALQSVSVTTIAQVPLPTPSNPNDLDLGSRGPAVIALQTFLITEATGPAAASLALSGATGYFGTLTQRALAEYQASVGIAPASGYYGPTTRAHIEGLLAATVPQSEDTPTIATSSIPTLPSTDLQVGSRGDDVLWLQNFLITKSIGPAAVQLGSNGATGYFGTLTQQALAEYQTFAGITPATGYFGPLTRAYIAANE